MPVRRFSNWAKVRNKETHPGYQFAKAYVETTRIRPTYLY